MRYLKKNIKKEIRRFCFDLAKIKNSKTTNSNSVLQYKKSNLPYCFYGLFKKPTYEILHNSKYVFKSWSAGVMLDVFIKNKEKMYDKDELKMIYNAYNKSVIAYFKNKSDKMIVINFGVKNDFERLCP